MMSVVDGDGFPFVVNTADRNGFDTWRKLVQHYDSEVPGSASEQLTTLLQPTKCEGISSMLGDIFLARQCRLAQRGPASACRFLTSDTAVLRFFF